MSRFAYVENNNVVELHDDLPKSWRNISGLDLLENNTEELNNLGWYEVQSSEITIDHTLETITGVSYVFEDNKVKQIINKANVTDIYTLEQLKSIILKEVRDARNRLLLESDWTQLADVIKVNSPEFNSAWENYRQQLRDLPASYQNTELTNISQVVWPSKPE
jgi:pyruvate formate-lyase activating enzyme-like uncharacterized protein